MEKVEAMTPTKASDRDMQHQLQLMESSNNIWQTVWEAYSLFCKRHQFSLEAVHQAVASLLVWTPIAPYSSDKREIVHGLLEVHRLLMDAALEEASAPHDSYGTTVKPDAAPTMRSASALRRILTVMHSLLPVLLQVSRNAPRARYQVERVKFLLRVVLLVSYWRDVYRQSHNLSHPSLDLSACLARRGSYYAPEMIHEETAVPTMSELDQRARRRSYVGRRTGRRVSLATMAVDSSDSSASLLSSRYAIWMRLILGELLHTYRPLYWAQVEQQHYQDAHSSNNESNLWKSWAVALAMEVVSLQCLKRAASCDNPVTKQEWNRRRLKLFLYLLRSPVWERATDPGLQQMAAVLPRLPLLGRMLGSYWNEWWLHWKHPLFSEYD